MHRVPSLSRPRGPTPTTPAHGLPLRPARTHEPRLPYGGARCGIACPPSHVRASASADDDRPTAPPSTPPPPWAHLPIEPVLPSIVDALLTHSACVLEAPPGAGKTTAVPLALAAAGVSVLVVEPRRLAAMSAARRMSTLLGQQVGGTVGYRVRGDARVSRSTRVLVVTPGIALKSVASGRLGYGCLMLDEAHERGAETDLLFALAAAALRGGGAADTPPYRVLVASATLGGGLADTAMDRLGGRARLVTAPAARAFPVKTMWAGAPPPGPRDLAAALLTATRSALATHPGDVLVFVPGAADVRAVVKGLQSECRDIDALPLHGGLPAAAQDAVLAPPPSDDTDRRRRVVVATNIAESSVTVPRVRVVIDSGLSRRSRSDPTTLLDRLHTLPTSAASADQRRGRAGRLGPGLCLRLWSEASHTRRAAATPPSLADGDIAPTALSLAATGWGDRWRELPWLDPPPEAGMVAAWRLLQGLGLVDVDTPTRSITLTPAGAAAAGVGAHPRLARMLLTSVDASALDAGAVLAALASSRDPVRGRAATADAGARVAALAGETGPLAEALDPRACQDVLDTALLLRRQVVKAVSDGSDASDDAEEAEDAPPPRAAAARAALATSAAAQLASQPSLAGKLLAAAYPDRLATRRARGNAGKAAAFVLPPSPGAPTTTVRLASPDDPLADAPLLVVPALVTPRAADRAPLAVLAARVEAADVGGGEDDAVSIEWVASAKRVVVTAGAQAAIPTPAVAAALASAIGRGGVACLGEPPAGRAWRARVAFAAAAANTDASSSPWPDVSNAGLAATAATWVTDAVAAAATEPGGLASLDWVEGVYGGLVMAEQRRVVEEVAPPSVAVGGGATTARLEYGPLPPPPPPITCPPSFMHTPPYAVLALEEAARAALTGGVAGAAAIVLTLGARTIAVAPTFDAVWADWGRVRAAAARAAGGRKGKEWAKRDAPVK